MLPPSSNGASGVFFLDGTMGMTGGRGCPSSVGRAADPRRLVLGALVRNRGNVTAAATELGIDRHWLYHQIERLELWPAVKELRRRKAEGKRAARYFTELPPGQAAAPVV